MNATFDTLAFARRLQEAGVNSTMSEAVASAIRDIAMNNVATKTDVREAIHSLTLRVGAIVGFSITIAVAILAAVISSQ